MLQWQAAGAEGEGRRKSRKKEESMKNCKQFWRSLGRLARVSVLALAAGLGHGGAAQAQDTDFLYVGDIGDNTVKRFGNVGEAQGKFLGAFVKRASAGLHGPRGLVFDQWKNLIVSDQNANTSTRGDILQFDGNGDLQNRLVSHDSPLAPAVPRGIVLWKNYLFVAEFSADARNNGLPGPGRLLKYTSAGVFVGESVPPAGVLGGGEFHPRGIVLGPDGKLYVSNFPDLSTGLGGQVLRFSPETGEFIDVFIASRGGGSCKCGNELNRPEGLVFSPDGNLYVTSFRADPGDTDKIVIFKGPAGAKGANPGVYLGAIALDEAGQPRAFAQALLFGPKAYLFVPISGNGPDTGSVRRYDLKTKAYDLFVAPGGALQQPWYLSFGNTDPATLEYRPQQ